MSIERCFCALLLLALLPYTAQARAQEKAPAETAPAKMYLDVVVAPKSGVPVAELQQQDFTVFDNNAPQSITSFQALGGSQTPVEIILVIDTVNASYSRIPYERSEIDKFLRANHGQLAQPISLAIFTDTGTQIQEGASRDGNALSASLDHAAIGLRSIGRSTGIYGADERIQLSLNTLHKLAAREQARPGRKIILWVSPGWPLLSGVRIDLDANQKRKIFSAITDLSTELRNARVTLYNVDPLGAGESIFGSSANYEEFLKGVSKVSDVMVGDLALQVMAVQTGGLALSGNNDIAAMLQRCVADTDAYYELSFNAPPAEHPDEYHHLEVRVAKPGLTARTRRGYYSQP